MLIKVRSAKLKNCTKIWRCHCKVPRIYSDMTLLSLLPNLCGKCLNNKDLWAIKWAYLWWVAIRWEAGVPLMATLGPFHNMVVQSFIYRPSTVNKGSDNNPCARKGLNQGLDNPVSRTQRSRHDPALIGALTIGEEMRPIQLLKSFDHLYWDVYARHTSRPSWSSLIYTFISWPWSLKIEGILNVLNGGRIWTGFYRPI